MTKDDDRRLFFRRRRGVPGVRGPIGSEKNNLGQDGHLGWDADARTRVGVLWGINSTWSVSAQWIHELYRYVQEEGGTHVPDDLFSFQIRMIF